MQHMEEAKIHVLNTRPEWSQRYDDLVKSKIITDQIFWSDKKEQITGYYAQSALKLTSMKQTPQQKAAAVLRSIRGVTDGRGEVKFKLTSEVIKALYKGLPLLKDLHSLHVTDGTLSEKDFWTQFCTSRTFGKELGIGEDFVGKGKDNLFDDAYSKTVLLEDSDVRVDYAQYEVSNEIDITRNDTNYADDGQSSSNVNKSIRHLNMLSIQSLEQVDIPAGTTIDEPLIPKPQKEHEQRTVHTSKPTYTTLDPGWYEGLGLYTFDQLQAANTPPSTEQFTEISEEMFTADHFAFVQRINRNVFHLLRIFWRLQPMNTSEKQQWCHVVLKGAGQVYGALKQEEWPEKELRYAAMLCESSEECYKRALERLESHPVPSKRPAS